MNRRIGLAGAVVTALAFSSMNANANDVSNNITGLGDTTFFGALHTDNFDFTDVFTYTVAGPVTVNASLVTIGSGLQNIDFLTASLNGVALTLSPNGFLETGSTVGDLNLNGPLVLTVTGKSGAAGGTFASYSGTMNVKLVPVPAAWALLASGLGVLGTFVRRSQGAGRR
jgi:hypothetical protein